MIRSARPALACLSSLLLLVIGIVGGARAGDLASLRCHHYGPSLQTALYSPNGLYYVAAGDDLVLFDAQNRGQIRILNPGVDDVPLAMDFSPDGAVLGVLYEQRDSDQMIIALLNFPAGDEIRRIPALPHITYEAHRRIRFSPDGTRIATSNFDGIAVYDVVTGESVWDWQVNRDTNPNRSRAAFDATPDWSYFLHSLQRIAYPAKETTEPIPYNQDSSPSYWHNVISPDGTQAIAAGGPNGTQFKLFDLETGELIRQAQEDIGTDAVVASTDFTRFITDNAIWNVTENTIITYRPYDGSNDFVPAVALRPDGAEITTGNLYFEATAPGDLVDTDGDGYWMEGDAGNWYNACYFAPDTGGVFVANSLWSHRAEGGPVVDLVTGEWGEERVPQAPFATSMFVRALNRERTLAAHSDATYVTAGGDSGEMLSEADRDKAFSGQWTADINGERYIAVASRAGYAVFDLQSGELATLREHSFVQNTMDVAVSSDGAMVAIWDGDWNAMYFSIYNATDDTAILERQQQPVQSDYRTQLQVAFTPDNQYLLKVFGKSVEVLNTIDWNTERTIRVASGRIDSVDISPDSTTLLLNNTNGRSEVVDLATGQVQAVLLPEPAPTGGSDPSTVLLGHEGTLVSKYGQADNSWFFSYPVAFDLAGHGTRSGGGALLQGILEGGSATAPEVSPDVDFTFTGWSTTFDTVTQAMTVTAQYEQADPRVTYHPGDHGTLEGGDPDVVLPAEEGTAPAPPTVIPESGYAFVGWEPALPAEFAGSIEVTAQYAPAILAYRGLNLSGAEFGVWSDDDHNGMDDTFPGNVPGDYGTHYRYPADEVGTYFLTNGLLTVRLPFRWDRLQPVLGEEFDAAELQRLHDTVASITSQGARVILDVRDQARHQGNVIGSAEVSLSHFAAFWGTLAAEFADNDRVIFGLMNEPHDIQGTMWLAAANAAMAAIRNADADNLILVPGINWTSAFSWHDSSDYGVNAELMTQIRDPGANFAIEVHLYFDADNSGTTNDVVSPTIGPERLAGFVGWCRENDLRGFLGEVGAAESDEALTALRNTLQYVENQASDVLLGWTYWTAAPHPDWIGTLRFNILPADISGSAPQPHPQLSVLQEFLPPYHSVAFELGPGGSRTGGGALQQTIAAGDTAVPPEVEAVFGWRFVGWNPPVPETITEPLATTAMYEPVNASPDTAVLLGPSGVIQETRPTLTWQAANRAEWYHVVIQYGDQHYFEHWTQDTELVSWWDWANGNYTFYVQTWGNGEFGDWSDGLAFTVDVAVLDRPTALAPDDTALDRNVIEMSWSAPTGATWYYVYIQRNGEFYMDEWFDTTQVQDWRLCFEQGDYAWWVQGWGPQNGFSQWSDQATFSIQSPLDAPGKPTPISPFGLTTSDQPTFSWGNTTDTQWTWLVIYRYGEPYYEQWLPIAGSFQSFWQFEPGNYQWWCAGWNRVHGLGEWSDGNAFTVQGWILRE